MAKVTLYNTQGKSIGEHELRDNVYGVKVNPTTVHEVVIGIRANARHPWAHTKIRSDVSGGGKKPWRQKGTGRARHGSRRSPIWIGGGVTFGPRNDRDYTKKINRKVKRAAFFMTLSDKVSNDRLILVDKLESTEGKTKDITTLISKLPAEGKVTMVANGDTTMLVRGARNLKDVRMISTASVGLMDVLTADYVIMTPDAAERIQELQAEASV